MRTVIVLLLAAVVNACATAPADPLAGTHWRLVQFQSMDDAIGVLRPDDPAKYELRLEPGGRASLRLDCNRAAGAWRAQASGPESGSFTMGPLAMTRAACPSGSLDTRIARDMAYVRSYLLRGDTLNLSLMADGGIYTWRRVAP